MRAQLLVTVLLSIGSGCGPDEADGLGTNTELPLPTPPTVTTDPTPGPTTPPDEPLSSGAWFHVDDGTLSLDLEWAVSDGAYVACGVDDTGRAKVRLAEDPSDAGTAGAYLDLVLCDFEGEGIHQEQPPGEVCGLGSTWFMSWNPTSFLSFANLAEAPRCELELVEIDDGRFEGSFGCSLQDDNGEVAGNITDALFRCPFRSR